jgi:hypothetical protein
MDLFSDLNKKVLIKTGTTLLGTLAKQAEIELGALAKKAETKINNTSAEDVEKGLGVLTARVVKIGEGCLATVKAGYDEEAGKGEEKAARPDSKKKKDKKKDHRPQ